GVALGVSPSFFIVLVSLLHAAKHRTENSRIHVTCLTVSPLFIQRLQTASNARAVRMNRPRALLRAGLLSRPVRGIELRRGFSGGRHILGAHVLENLLCLL